MAWNIVCESIIPEVSLPSDQLRVNGQDLPLEAVVWVVEVMHPPVSDELVLMIDGSLPENIQ